MSTGLDGIGNVFGYLVYGSLVMFPLATWKIIDIIVWVFKHVNVEWVS